MFGFFKKKGCKLQHFKRAGYALPDNMKLVLRFDRRPDKYGYLGYALYECAGCGKRAFACSACLVEPKEFESAIDDFIGHKIELDALLIVFSKYKTSYELSKDQK